MAHFTERNLNQTAVYWGAPTNDGYGNFVWNEPIEISCRWEDSMRIVVAVTGEEKVSAAEVQVAQDLDENGMLLMGTLVALDSDQLDDPVAAGASLILRFDKIPTLDAIHFYRKAYL